jgi:hypothetical protein
MNRKFGGILAGAAALLASACTAPITTQLNVTDPAPETLRVDSLAVLPFTVDPGLEAYGRGAGEELYAALRDAHPDLTLIAPSQSLERLTNARATTAYANLIEEYEETGQLNPELVRQLGDAVGARHLLNMRLTYAEEAGYGPADLVGEIEYEGQGLRVIAQLWDGERGVLEWRMIGDVTAVASDLMRQRDADELLEAILPEIAEAVPVEGGEALAEVPVKRGPEDRTVFMGASGLLLLAFLFL